MIIKKRIITLFIFLSFLISIFTLTSCNVNISIDNKEEYTFDSLSHEGYTLDKVVVLSRHNIRSPLSGNGSALSTITPHEWFNWSSDPSELSIRGGILENEMGQYFRKWLESEGLFTKNYLPNDDEVRIYSNSMQRTISTAKFFTSGLLPLSNTNIEYHMEINKMDPVFTPQFTFMSDSYKEDIIKELNELFQDDINNLKDNYSLLEEVIDVKDSQDYKSGKFDSFKLDDTNFILEINNEPKITGSLKTACSVSDALVLQYYEEADPLKAAFNHKLSLSDWEKIAKIKDVYGDVLFTSPLISSHVAHPLLDEINKELTNTNRKFTFLCGHDSNVGSVLSSLNIEPYDLPGAIEKTTPIGCKVVFSIWKDNNNDSYISIDLVYQTVNQLKELTILDLNNTPGIVNIKLKDLAPNNDGLYNYDDVIDRLSESILKYDQLKEKYL